MIIVVHAHPDPESYTSYIATAVADHLRSTGIDAIETDLYRCDKGAPFPPVLNKEELERKTSLEPTVQRQMSLIEEATGYVVVHPDWWGGPPAVMKGWIDRVLRPGTAYERPEGFDRSEPEGLLNGRRALIIVPGDGDAPGPLEDFWVNRVWGFCGVTARLFYLPRIGESSRQERMGNLTGILEELNTNILG